MSRHMELVKVGDSEFEVFGKRAAMKLILAMPHCPKCALLPDEHNDDKCPMRWIGDSPEGLKRRLTWLSVK